MTIENLIRLMAHEHACCYEQCTEPATFGLYYSAAPDDFTEACTVHVGELCQDGGEVTFVYEIRVNPFTFAKDRP